MRHIVVVFIHLCLWVTRSVSYYSSSLVRLQKLKPSNFSLNSSSGSRMHVVWENRSVVQCAHEAHSMSSKFGVGAIFMARESERTCVVACGEVREENGTDSGESSMYTIRAPTGERLVCCSE